MNLEWSDDGTIWNEVPSSKITGDNSASWTTFNQIVKLATCDYSCIQFRFHFHSDGSITKNGGAAIDDFKITHNNSSEDPYPVTISFDNNCSLTATEDIRIKITNTYDDYICDIPVKCVITHGILPTQTLNGTITGPIYKNQIVEYTFSTQADLSGAGIYTLTGSTEYGAADHDLTNNSVVVTAPYIETTPYSNDFNGGADGWYAAGTVTWAQDTYTNMGGNAGYGNSWVTTPAGNYPNSANAYLYSPIFDLTSNPNPILEYDIKYETESGADYAKMQWSATGLEGTWTDIPNAKHTGSSGSSYIHVVQDLKINQCDVSCVMLRLWFHTDGSVVKPGNRL